MITVSDFKKAGLVFVGEDIINAVTGDAKQGGITIGDATRNGELPIHEGWVVKEFAWRGSAVSAECFSGKIEVKKLNGDITITHSGYLWFVFNTPNLMATKWRPSLNQLEIATETPEEKEALDKIFGADSAPKYDASKVTELEVSKVDIDWSEATEATHYCPSNKQFSEVFIKDLTDKGYSYRVVGNTYLNGEWEVTDPIVKGELYGIIEKPTEPQPPVYTQEMLDNGECPQVGMECEWNAHTTNIKLTFIGDKMFCGINDSGTESAGYLQDLRPLPPKQVLFDGEAYQFDCSHEPGITGIYVKGDDVFCCIKENYPSTMCTNITLLTPEEK